jgi:hypothetical protein
LHWRVSDSRRVGWDDMGATFQIPQAPNFSKKFRRGGDFSSDPWSTYPG